MTVVSKQLALALSGALAIGVVAACGTSYDRPVSTITYSAKQPRPDATGTSKRTLDNTGFIDNAGRSSEQRGRSEMSGMRATETGGERPTGTPGSGFPLPIDPATPPTEDGTDGSGTLGGDQGDTAGAPGDSVVGRLVRARCDRETACDRVGPNRPLKTGEQCMAQLRERTRKNVVDAECGRGFDTTPLAICLNAIRQAPCDASLVTLDTIPACASSAICAQ